MKTTVYYAQCRENGKIAWLDYHGIQFEGEDRFEASTKPICKTETCYITYEHDPLYPDDCIPVVRFHNSLEEAKAYAKEMMWMFDTHVDVFEAERR